MYTIALDTGMSLDDTLEAIYGPIRKNNDKDDKQTKTRLDELCYDLERGKTEHDQKQVVKKFARGIQPTLMVPMKKRLRKRGYDYLVEYVHQKWRDMFGK